MVARFTCRVAVWRLVAERHGGPTGRATPAVWAIPCDTLARRGHTWRAMRLHYHAVRRPAPSVVLLISLLAALLAWSGGSSAAAQTYVAAPTPVRVLLAVTGSVTVSMAGPHSGVVDGRGGFFTPGPLAWPVGARDGQLVVDGHEIGTSLVLDAEGGTLEAFGTHYRGAIRLSAVGDEVEVVNVLDLEAYLRGVVPAEMAASWPMEALKAQAVASRSYTLVSLDPEARYDLCATTDCQVYGGVEAEQPRTDDAVAATTGVVVTYGGATARTYYHSDSGGMIASSREVWGTSYPYLVAVRDAASSTPHRAWTARLDTAAVSASLVAAGRGVGTVTALRVLETSESGRVVSLEVAGTGGTTVIGGSQLTSLARGWGLKSMRFSMQGPLSVRGDGWGHGVGMSQYGARALAQAGYDYGRILAYFYPTTTLTRFVAQTP